MKKDFIKNLIMLTASFGALAMCVVALFSFAWFHTNTRAQGNAGGITVSDAATLSCSDAACYRFRSVPSPLADTMLYLPPYDYVIAENNITNNAFVLLEIELLKPDISALTLKVTAENEPEILHKQYSACVSPENIADVRGAPVYVLHGIDYAVYYYDSAAAQYKVCTDYRLMRYNGSIWTYDGKSCFYSTYYLSDCVTVEYCMPDIADIRELQSKNAVGGLTGFADFYSTLTAYFSKSATIAAAFVDTTQPQWQKQTALTFHSTVTADKIKSIGGKRYVYLAVSFRYTAAVMTNDTAGYAFPRNIHQLFYSDIGLVVE